MFKPCGIFLKFYSFFRLFLPPRRNRLDGIENIEMYLINPVFLYAVDAETHIINHHVLAFLRQVIGGVQLPDRQMKS